VNPYGVQQDGLWVEGSSSRWGPPIDHNPDFIWSSAGRINSQGWVAELEIPLKSLRFPEKSLQDWGIQVTRRIQRTGYDESWAPITQDVANQLTQTGTLSGLRDLDPGLFFEFNPVLTGKRIGGVDSETGAFDRENPEASFGFNLTYGLTSNLTLDGTYNPDFSQVEADAGQILVNERFAVFLPEKRPFFLEGTEIFSLPQRLVYTRSIVDPIGGAKMTGKLGGFNLGYLGAVDEVTSTDQNSSSYVNLVRARRDVGASSTVGLTFTDRSESTQVYNRVAGLDTRLVFKQRYTLEAQVAGSMDARTGLDAASGGLLFGKLSRSGRNLSFNVGLENTTPDFRARSGFIRRVGVAESSADVRYNFYGDRGALLERWGPSFEVQGLWDHDDFWSMNGWKETRMETGINFSFRNNVTLWVNGTRRDYDYGAEEYDGLFVDGGEDGLSPYRPDQSQFQGLYGFNGMFFLSTWDAVRGNIRFGWQETPIFDRVTRTPVETADAYSANLGLNLYLTRSLRGEVGVRHESLFRKSDGSRYSSATIPRVRAQYQFSKAFFVRSIVEYGSQEAGDLLDPATGNPLTWCSDEECYLRNGSSGNDIHFEFLASYEPSPGTVVYLGYTRNMEDTGRFTFENVTPQSDGLFFKVSYRFRF
jgi:hypothetical protein